MIELLAIAALTFKTRKGNTIMTTKTSIAHKPSQEVIDSATQNAVPMVTVHCLRGGKKSPYSALTSHRSHFSAFTIAALMVANYVTISAKGAPTAGKKNRQFSMLRGLIGASAWSHWNGTTERLIHEAGYTDDDTGEKFPQVQEITTNGLNCIQARLSGNGKGYNTDLPTVHAFRAAILEGGKVKIDDREYDFSETVSFMRQ